MGDMTMTIADKPALWMVWPHQRLEIDLKPLQGLWTEQLYLKLTDQTNQLIEFSDGEIEVLPMPTRRHQVVLALLYELFVAVVRPQGGLVLFSALRMQIRPAKYREPDLLLLLDRNDSRNQDAFWLGADLVIEIVSPDDPERDTITKRVDYAEANIPEYWIVNPLTETITVLTLTNGHYVEHGIFQRGGQASSQLLPGFTVAVNEIFDA
jgi:Uma2 family endonuclease